MILANQDISADAYLPNPGGQRMFHACPAFECLAWGNRGGGKTLGLLVEFARHVGEGFGEAWRGIIFRREFKDLQGLVNESLEWLPRIAPGGEWKRSPDQYRWVWPTGEQLRFCHAKHEQDYWGFHGQQWPFLGFEELTEWADPKLYLKLFSICRSTARGIPRKIRATTNPSGAGHAWVKRRFIDAAPEGFLIQDKSGRERCHLRIDLDDNTPLLEADPHYRSTLETAASGDPNILKAWLYGDWDITSGGMFDDLWAANVHVVPRFEVPSDWRISRCFDWGSTKPFACLWVARSPSGVDPIPHAPQSAFVIGEHYGSTGEPNVGLKLSDDEIGRAIAERESELGWRGRVRPGAADNMIFPRDNNGHAAADVYAKHNVRFVPAAKGPGSREQGWQTIRSMLSAAVERDEDGRLVRNPRPERPGLYFVDTCRDTIRTLPSLPRDKKKPDDVNTEAEDHIADALRYELTQTQPTSTTKQLSGWV
ncbi:MAG: terminase [Planctomycetota bacterium]